MKGKVTGLSGNNIYLDRYKNTVYYNIFDKKGYVVSKKNEQKFRLFYYRYSIIFIVMILLGDYFYSLKNTLLVGIGAVVLVEAYFRMFFLKKLEVIDNFKRENKTSRLEETVKSKEKEKTIMKSCAYMLLSILVVINAIQQNFNIIFILISCGVALYSFYIGIINAIAFTRIKKL